MNPIIRNILAIIAGWLVGSIVNMSIVKIGHTLLPIENIDTNNLKELATIMPTLDAKHFIFPFVAHALGTLGGALVAALIAATHKMKIALGIGVLFLIGGILASYMLPAPTWFIITDLACAYIPMAWIGGKIASKNTKVIT
ncbi:hypothetical protein ACFSTE_16270 [Aquimarina hainanensis]|uniref:Uncharacterized protein n=1 Tax=Aquimarina hainanensis TaxID=1578017 RepID=A0ABW5NC33_9FLAO|nr:hypothetical protein [Aquimarina sp. TRL1]QKX07095.1 hypothetical protein HN014_19970 [Aquimarina sp. TRL1]